MQLSRSRILYVEDHADTRELITLVLCLNGFDVMTCSTVEAGIELASQTAFDLYLLDSWLPDGSGLDLCKRIRQFDQQTPILFYSAAAYEDDRDTALDCGAQAYLVKPSQLSELCALVSGLIERYPRTCEITST